MKTVEEIRKKIDELYYWDMQMVHLSCDYLVDEVTLTYLFNDDKVETTYHFKGCYESSFKHYLDYKKGGPTKDMPFTHVSYYMQSVEVEEFEVHERDGYGRVIQDRAHDIYRYLRFKIDAHPMMIEIVCEDIEFSQKKYENQWSLPDVKVSEV